MHSDAKIYIFHNWQVVLEATNCAEVSGPAKECLVSKQAPDTPVKAANSQLGLASPVKLLQNSHDHQQAFQSYIVDCP